MPEKRKLKAKPRKASKNRSAVLQPEWPEYPEPKAEPFHKRKVYIPKGVLIFGSVSIVIMFFIFLSMTENNNPVPDYMTTTQKQYIEQVPVVTPEQPLSEQRIGIQTQQGEPVSNLTNFLSLNPLLFGAVIIMSVVVINQFSRRNNFLFTLLFVGFVIFLWVIFIQPNLVTNLAQNVTASP